MQPCWMKMSVTVRSEVFCSVVQMQSAGEALSGQTSNLVDQVVEVSLVDKKRQTK